MNSTINNHSKPIDDLDLGPNFGSYCRVHIDFERNGLACFDKTGRYGDINGRILIEAIRKRFEQLEMYKDCAFLRDFLVKYNEHFPA